MKSAQNYKTLYHTLAKQSDQKDRLIDVMQQQLTQLAMERQTLNGVIASHQEQLTDQAVQLTEQQTLLQQYGQIISGQGEKLSQQEIIIREQNVMVSTQQKELDNCKGELIHLHRLRYELITLKKWVFGIKSEKRHQPSGEQPAASAGEQLSLSMEVDSWGTCKVSDRYKVPEHLRVVTSNHA
jgi:chromosome segregation ATPase